MSDPECMTEKYIRGIAKYRRDYIDTLIEKYVNSDEPDYIIDLETLTVVDSTGNALGDMPYPCFGTLTNYSCEPAKELIKHLSEEQENQNCPKLDKNVHEEKKASVIAVKRKPSHEEKKASVIAVKRKPSHEEKKASVIAVKRKPSHEEKKASVIAVKRKPSHEEKKASVIAVKRKPSNGKPEKIGEKGCQDSSSMLKDIPVDFTLSISSKDNSLKMDQSINQSMHQSKSTNPLDGCDKVPCQSNPTKNLNLKKKKKKTDKNVMKRKNIDKCVNLCTSTPQNSNKSNPNDDMHNCKKLDVAVKQNKNEFPASVLEESTNPLDGCDKVPCQSNPTKNLNLKKKKKKTDKNVMKRKSIDKCVNLCTSTPQNSNKSNPNDDMHNCKKLDVAVKQNKNEFPASVLEEPCTKIRKGEFVVKPPKVKSFHLKYKPHTKIRRREFVAESPSVKNFLLKFTNYSTTHNLHTK